jgi:FKBP-type peptidyl-prolyl cis-trans isomerase
MKKFSFLVLILQLLLFSCKNEPYQAIKGYTYCPEGYYYHLSAFTDDAVKPHPNDLLWLEASFKTLKDSVFWDSRHDASGRFFMRLGDTIQNPQLKHLLRLTEGDSMCYYFRTRDFYNMYFKTDKIPFFSLNDSLVKADIKLKSILNEENLNALFQNFANEEDLQVENFVAAAKNEAITKDTSGIIWIEHTRTGNDAPHYGSQLSISYKGYFLDGKLIDNSNGNFNMTYGTPDQLLKGLNFVIKEMRKGEYAKIILPSSLAYGKTGSSNGAIPPFTPLLYEIQLTEVK